MAQAVAASPFSDKNKDKMEVVHHIVKKVFVFKIPPRAATGYKAAEWSKEALWGGRLRIVEKGDECFLLLEHLDESGLFAACRLHGTNAHQTTIEPVTDSGRYFVLRIEDGKGRYALIGLGFHSKDESLEFKIAVQRYQDQSSANSKAEEYMKSLPELKLGANESIKINLPNAKKKPKSEEASDASASLAPPPDSSSDSSAEKKKKKKKKKDASSNEASPSKPDASLIDLSGLSIGSADNKAVAQPKAQAQPQVQAQAQAQPQAQAQASDWVSFE